MLVNEDPFSRFFIVDDVLTWPDLCECVDTASCSFKRLCPSGKPLVLRARRFTYVRFRLSPDCRTQPLLHSNPLPSLVTLGVSSSLGHGEFTPPQRAARFVGIGVELRVDDQGKSVCSPKATGLSAVIGANHVGSMRTLMDQTWCRGSEVLSSCPEEQHQRQTKGPYRTSPNSPVQCRELRVLRPCDFSWLTIQFGQSNVQQNQIRLVFFGEPNGFHSVRCFVDNLRLLMFLELRNDKCPVALEVIHHDDYHFIEFYEESLDLRPRPGRRPRKRSPATSGAVIAQGNHASNLQ